MNKQSVCGCGECEACITLTKEILSRQTVKEREYDRYVTRLTGSDDFDEDDL